MSFLILLQILVCLATAATGLLAFVKPDAVYGFTGLTVSGVRGISEIRAIFGGLFIALGASPLLLGPVAFDILGIGYLAIAATRTFSIFFDHSNERSNLISLAIEIVFGILLLY